MARSSVLYAGTSHLGNIMECLHVKAVNHSSSVVFGVVLPTHVEHQETALLINITEINANSADSRNALKLA